jgi:GNAT superfamily N-acetyltransferase
MKKIYLDQYKHVRSIFHNDYPNLPLVHSIIEGLRPGQVWIDKEIEPNLSLVISKDAYCFISGVIDEATFQDCFHIIKEKPIIKLVFDPLPLFNIAKYGFKPVPRRQYRYKHFSDSIPIYKNHNEDLVIQKIEDSYMFNLCIWKPLMVDIFGSSQNYLRKGIGFVLWDSRNELVACECHGIPSKEFMEVLVITHEKYTRRGLATILCNHLIHVAIDKGLKPVWSCNEDNVFSWRAAEKQGMDELIKYNFYTRTLR